MIDFQNKSFLKLNQVDETKYQEKLAVMLASNECVLQAFRSVRDSVIFTNKRIIVINVQGVTGKKKDFTSLPYNKIQAYSVESAGVFDIESELELWFSGGMGQLRFEFCSGVNIAQICQVISEHSL